MDNISKCKTEAAKNLCETVEGTGIKRKKEGRKVLREKLKIAEEENETLKKLVDETSLELEQLRKNVTSLNDVIKSDHGDGVGDGSNVASSKIIDLSKRNRSLRVELCAVKSKHLKMVEKAANLEEELLKKDEKSANKKVPCCEAADQLQSTKQKLFETLNQNSELKNNLKLAQKCIQQEIGDNVNLTTLASHGTGWRGRSQQILALQNKVSELKEKLEMSSLGDEPFKQELRRLELIRKTEVEQLTTQLNETNSTVAELRSKVSALKVRNKNLSDEAMSYKLKLFNLTETCGHDQLLAVFNEQMDLQKRQYESKLEEISKQSRDLEKTKNESNMQVAKVTSQMHQIKSILNAKEDTIEELSGIVMNLENDLRAVCGGFLFSCRDLKKQEFLAILDSLESEKEGLVQQVNSLNKRVNIERDKIAKLTDDLAKQKCKYKELQKNFDSQSEKRKSSKRMTSDRSVSSPKVENSARALEVKLEDFKNKLELSTEKITFLQERITFLNREKEFDNKTFNEILANSKNILLNMIQETKQPVLVEEGSIAETKRSNSDSSTFDGDSFDNVESIQENSHSECGIPTIFVKLSPKIKNLNSN